MKIITQSSCRTWFFVEYHALTMCAQDVHTTHIETNMENIKNNALLYIEHSYIKTYNYYKA
jgi:hypothetical protein